MERTTCISPRNSSKVLRIRRLMTDHREADPSSSDRQGCCQPVASLNTDHKGVVDTLSSGSMRTDQPVPPLAFPFGAPSVEIALETRVQQGFQTFSHIVLVSILAPPRRQEEQRKHLNLC